MQGSVCRHPRENCIICFWAKVGGLPAQGSPRRWSLRRKKAGILGQGEWKRRRPALVHPQLPCSDGLVRSCHQPWDVIKLLMNPNVSLGSQELSLVSSACRLILVFPSFSPSSSLSPLPPSSQASKKKKSLIYYHFPHCWHGNTGVRY